MTRPSRKTPSTKTANRWICSRQSSIHGRGVYAACIIPSDTRVVEYTGERITKAEARRREDQRLERQRRGGDDCVYIFDLNKKYDLDGRSTRNIARLINHSCTPNCRAETIRGRVWITVSSEAQPEWPLDPPRQNRLPGCSLGTAKGLSATPGRRHRPGGKRHSAAEPEHPAAGFGDRPGLLFS